MFEEMETGNVYPEIRKALNAFRHWISGGDALNPARPPKLKVDLSLSHRHSVDISIDWWVFLILLGWLVLEAETRFPGRFFSGW